MVWWLDMGRLETFEIGGQRYVRGGEVVHRTGERHAITLVVWHSNCPDCGAPFTVKCGTRTARPLRPNRRCPACHRPRVRVGRALVHAGFVDCTLLASPPLRARLSIGVARTGATLGHALPNASREHREVPTDFTFSD